MRALERVLACYPDEEGAIEAALLDGDLIYDDAAATIRRVLSGEESVDVTGELTAIDVAFARLLKLAYELDETLRTSGDASAAAVLRIFHGDLLVLAEATGADLSAMQERWEGSEHLFRLKPGKHPVARAPTSAEERRRRDAANQRPHRSLAGAPVTPPEYASTSRARPDGRDRRTGVLAASTNVAEPDG